MKNKNKSSITSLLKSASPFIAIIGVTLLIFFKIFTKGLYPIPGDLLVSFYFPWYSGGWVGYDPWTTHKEMLAADSIRQIYLWKEFAAQQFLSGHFPLWNPFTFSGQPLLANFQSSVFYPFNIFYFLTDARNAWIILVAIQPLLAGIFMYICLKGFKIPKVSALFGSIAFMFSSYLITWMENGNVSQSYLWLPLAIFAVNKFFENFQLRYILILVFSLTLSILAGHPQTAIYIYIASFLFFLFKLFEKRLNIKHLAYYFAGIILSISLSAIQLLPTYSFYKVSPIHLPFAQDVFDRSILPFQNLITFFASDFFGHPATNNFWNVSYGDFTPYFGVIPLLFALWGIFTLFKDRLIRFSAVVSALFVLASVKGPVTFLIKQFQIPLLDATSPSRFLSITIFFLIIIASTGFADFVNNLDSKKYLRGFLKFSLLPAFVYVLLWSFTFLGKIIFKPHESWAINLSVTQHNLILPTAMFLVAPFIVVVLLALPTTKLISKSKLQDVLIAAVLVATIFGGVYYSNKFLPVSPKKFIFPDHPILTWLKNNAGINRFYGSGTAHVDYNFPLHYQIYGTEGYDTLRFERYAQLLASIPSGRVPESYFRSDASVPDENNSSNKKRILDLLGVKYLLDKEDNPKTGADWHYERFPNDKLEGLVQYSRAQIYLRVDALPRIFMTTKYIVAKSDNEILSNIYSGNFDLRNVILEQEPDLAIDKAEADIVIPQVLSYLPSFTSIKTNNSSNSLLFISDSYDKDWKVYIDGRQSPLLRADYALRAVAVPNGEHEVRFKYEPTSFKIGFYVNLLSIVLVLSLTGFAIAKRRF